jgi:hypothetical protein
MLESNAETHRILLDRQQERIGYPLILQDVAKSGLRYGLGLQKVFWDERWIKGKKVLKPATVETADGPSHVQGTEDRLVYEGPMAEWVDPFDFIWDPLAFDMRSMGWCVHRLWFTDEQVKDRIERGQWKLPEGVELEDALSTGREEERDEIRRERDAASGYERGASRAGKINVFWEGWDARDGTTCGILNGCIPVLHGENPFWHGELPFQAYRPTSVEGEFVGIGEIEAIEDLQHEMNEMRTQRRDNAAIVLQRPFAYMEGMVDIGDVAFGPGTMIPTEADPSAVLFPIPLQDIPNSSYQEEANLQRDIERITGIDDTVSGGEGGGGASATATGVQMVQAAAGIRIQQKTKRLSWEVVKPAAGQFLELNQQKILRTEFIPGPPLPGEPTQEWSWYEIGPSGLAGTFEVMPDDMSLAPPSPVEKMDKANRVVATFGQNPLIKPEKLAEWSLSQYDVPNPRSWLVPPVPTFTPDDLALAAQGLGIDPNELVRLAGEAQQMRAEQEELAGTTDGAGAQQAAPPVEQNPGM